MKLGKAFSDSVVVERRREHRLLPENSRAWWLGAGRILMFAVIFFFSFFTLVFRLFDLTVVRGHAYRVLADGNRTRELVRHAPRGILRDRTGIPLVANTSQYRLLQPCGKGEAPLSEGGCVQYLTKEKGQTMEKAGLPMGTFLEADYQRSYLFKESVAQVVGYTGELSDKEMGDDYYTLRNYRRGDRIGRAGAEAVYEDRLRGRDGKELVEVDANGKILRILGRDPEISGSDVTLSIDAALSEVVRNSFPADAKGAIVVSKPATGEILALYSNPSYDPNIFTSGLSQKEYAGIMDDPSLPMFDRAIGGVYPPGSIFKIVTALAGLEEKDITKDTIIEDNGTITIGPYSFSNWYFTQYGRTEGPVDVVKAIQRSNDIFFYKVGEKIGISKLATWARKVGLGAPLGIELPGETSGLMPDPDWKNQQFHTPADLAARNNQWYAGDTYHVAIGQGYLLTTPLQVNTWTNIIANGGKLCRPTIEKVSGVLRHPAVCKDLGINRENIDLISTGMRKACDEGGTGWPLFNFGIGEGVKDGEATPSGVLKKIPVACKTGTAEFGDPGNKTHAWFTVFAPVPAEDQASRVNSGDTQNQPITISGDPEISITVLVEGGGEGSSVAAPIAKKILEAWFGR